MSPLKTGDCSYFQLNEIRLCDAVNCALWLFRACKHPCWAEAQKIPVTDANSKPSPTPPRAGSQWGATAHSRLSRPRENPAGVVCRNATQTKRS
jgi:hypothetical protein